MHEPCRPFVFVRRVNALERFLHIRRIEPDQRILPDLGAANRLYLDLVDSSLAAFFLRNRILCKGGCRNDDTAGQQ